VSPDLREAAGAELAGVASPLRASFLEALAAPDGTSRTRQAGHLTASAVVLDPAGSSVLLVLHRKVGLWLQPGGHVDDTDPSLSAAALRETGEETGVPGLVVDAVPVDLDRHPAPCGARWHLDVRFLVRAPWLAAPVVSEESLDVRWWPVDALPEQRVDLGPLVRAGLQRLRA